MLHNVIIQAAHYYSEKEKQVAAHIRVKYGNAMVFAHPTQRRRQPCHVIIDVDFKSLCGCRTTNEPIFNSRILFSLKN